MLSEETWITQTGAKFQSNWSNWQLKHNPNTEKDLHTQGQGIVHLEQ